MPRIFNPVHSSTSDGSDITLCRILEAAANIEAAMGGGGGGTTAANPAVDPSGNRVPLNVNADGELEVNVEASINADLTTIEGNQDTANGLLTNIAADLAAPLQAIITDGTHQVAVKQIGTPVVATDYGAVSQAVIHGQTTGGGGGYVDVKVNPSGSLVVDASGSTGVGVTSTDISTIATEAVAIDNKLPALSSGRVPVEANNVASQVFSFTQTGAISAGTVLIPATDCAQFREIAVHVISVGSGGTAPIAQISNDGTNWVTTTNINSAGTTTNNGSMSVGVVWAVNTFGAKNFRVVSAGTQTSGTTTLVAYASQQATPKLYQQVSGTVSLSANSQITPVASTNTGYGVFHSLVSAASTNATNVKNTQGQIGSLVLSNNSASLKWVRLFNSATAPTVGTSTPVLNYPLQPNSTIDLSTSCAGLRFTSGIAYAITGGSASAAVTDSVAVAAGDVTVNMVYA